MELGSEFLLMIPLAVTDEKLKKTPKIGGRKIFNSMEESEEAGLRGGPQQQRAVGPQASERLPPFRVLLVDDNGINRAMLQRALKLHLGSAASLQALGRSCLEMATAVHGREAVDLVLGQEEVGQKQSGGFDLILMDCSMPVMDGITATRLIRDSGYKGLIFGCTGNSLSEDQRTFQQAGSDAVFIKPVNANTLVKKVIDSFLQKQKQILAKHQATNDQQPAVCSLHTRQPEADQDATLRSDKAVSQNQSC